jgi:hypothetical protein
MKVEIYEGIQEEEREGMAEREEGEKDDGMERWYAKCHIERETGRGKSEARDDRQRKAQLACARCEGRPRDRALQSYAEMQRKACAAVDKQMHAKEKAKKRRNGTHWTLFGRSENTMSKRPKSGEHAMQWQDKDTVCHGCGCGQRKTRRADLDCESEARAADEVSDAVDAFLDDTVTGERYASRPAGNTIL